MDCWIETGSRILHCYRGSTGRDLLLIAEEPGANFGKHYMFAFPFFNILNRVNFGLPGSTVGSPTYGVDYSGFRCSRHTTRDELAF